MEELGELPSASSGTHPNRVSELFNVTLETRPALEAESSSCMEVLQGCLDTGAGLVCSYRLVLHAGVLRYLSFRSSKSERRWLPGACEWPL